MANLIAGTQTLSAGVIYTAPVGTDIRVVSPYNTYSILWRPVGTNSNPPVVWNTYLCLSPSSLKCAVETYVMSPVDITVDCILGVV